MKNLRPPRDPKKFKAYIRKMTMEYMRRLSLEDHIETSQNSRRKSTRLAAIAFLKRNSYEVGRRIIENDLFDELRIHVSTQAKKHRSPNSGFANRNDNVFVWVLRLVVLCQAKQGWDQLDRKTMSKYAHQLSYALMHDIHTSWLIEFLRQAGSDQQISDRLKAYDKIVVPNEWHEPKP